MKNSKWKIFLRGIKLGTVLATGAALIGIIEIGGAVMTFNGTLNSFAYVCAGAVAMFGGTCGFVYGIKEAIDENKALDSIQNNTETNTTIDIDSTTNVEQHEKVNNIDSIEPIKYVDDVDIKNEFYNNENQKTLILKKETRKF